MEDTNVILSHDLLHEGLCLILLKAHGFLYMGFEIVMDTQWALLKTTSRPSMLYYDNTLSHVYCPLHILCRARK
jgi:hypothetical protein